jgi:hypothetical protein
MGCLKIHTLEIEKSPLKVAYKRGVSEANVVQRWYQACPVDVYIIGIYYVDVNIIGVDPKAEQAWFGMSPYCARFAWKENYYGNRNNRFYGDVYSSNPYTNW